MKKRVSNALVGIAGVHYVAAELSRRGLIALPTIRNTAGYDIIVATPDGKRHANIQVKTSQKPVKYWPTPPSKEIRAEPDDCYVLVRWVESERKFEGFMLTGAEARDAVRSVEAEQRKRIRDGTRKKEFPCVRVDSSWEELGNCWRRQWETWSL